MKVNEYRVLSEAVEAGVAIGIHRAYKHLEIEPPAHLATTLESDVLNEICEYFCFELPNGTND